MATENKLKELASQLRMPYGMQGTDIGKMMQETNAGMIRDAVHHLHICSGDHILELGHGNGQHIPDLLNRHPDIRYTGLEISPLMQQESIAANERAVASGKAAFFIYDGNTLPFAAATFSKI